MLEENGGHSADDILVYIFKDEKFYTHYVAGGPIPLLGKLSLLRGFIPQKDNRPVMYKTFPCHEAFRRKKKKQIQYPHYTLMKR